MFTGIIEQRGEVVDIHEHGGNRTITLRAGWPVEAWTIGESLACNGVCLTVEEATKNPLPLGEGRVRESSARGVPLTPALSQRERERATQHSLVTLTLSPETIALTTARDWVPGTRLHLERALRLCDRLGGHLVTGHVDGIATLQRITPQGGSHALTFTVPPSLARFIAAKGSVALDGISLTVNQVEGTQFTVMIIPHTWEHTTLRDRKTGDALNLEVDMMARYVARLQEASA
jgi:riboflavin synthase